MIALVVPALFSPIAHAAMPCVANTFPPRSHPLDLPTLFACLLI